MDVWERCWNVDSFIVFQMVILKCTRNVSVTQAIQQNIMTQLDMWEAGKHQTLVEYTTCTCKQYLYNSRQEDSEY